MIEFTGERVVPGQVNDDLWAEHAARYAFALRLASGKRILDVGCGTGYGCAELAREMSLVTGIDPAPEALAYAREHFSVPNVSYAQASAAELPFAPAVFDLILAFEVIEHLENWRGLLKEARRVLHPEGLFLVSTPNRLYYAESRAREGPNPFHAHEFEYEEYRAALQEFFPHVRILFQDRVESFAFHGDTADRPVDVRIDRSQESPAGAHFFIAVCGIEREPTPAPFLYLPRAANMLRERERHIQMLQSDLAHLIADHQALQNTHEQQTAHLESQNRWALELEQTLNDARTRIAELQEELQSQQVKAAAIIDELQEQNVKKTQWALETEARLTAELAARAEQHAATVRLLDAAEQNVIERTQWAQRLDAELRQLQAQMEMIRQSRWIALGRTVGLGPRLEKSPGREQK